MAIVIPSKHIYSKSFDPVIDNVINKVYTNEYYGNYEQKTFFNETFVGFTAKTSELSAYITDYNDVSSNNSLPLVTGISGVARTLTLSWQKEVSGFKLAKDWLLYTTIIQKEVDQEINLEMSVNYKYFNTLYPSGMGEGEASYSDEKEVFNLQFELKEFSSAQAFVNEYFDKTGEIPPYLPDYTVKSINDSKLLIIGYIPTQTSVTFYFLINKDGYYYDSNKIRSLILKNVDIKIYNDVDWQVRSYGNGTKPFVVNENKSMLLQTNTTNGNKTQGKYLAQTIIDEWKNGKQTAVITCLIAEYYEENAIPYERQEHLVENTTYVNPFTHVSTGNIDMSSYMGTENAKILSVKYVRPTNIVDSLAIESVTITKYTEKGFSYIVKLNEKYGNIESVTVKFNVLLEIEKDKPIISQRKESKKMIFEIGDIVIPYTYTNKGDIPISYNRDLTQKKFRVIGTSILKKQGVQQVLTLQEV